MQADLEAIRSALLQRRGAIVNLTGDESTLAAARPQVCHLCAVHAQLQVLVLASSQAKLSAAVSASVRVAGLESNIAVELSIIALMVD